MSVLPEYQEHYIASAVVQRAFSEASQAGYEVALAYPMETAEGLYHRYGVRQIGQIDCVTIGSELSVDTLEQSTADRLLLLDKSRNVYKDTVNE
ncbi:MAG: hypothetical protein ACU84Q_03715 [Gammaproteobacteria bacterium]